jgi:hypothetical protein
MVCFPTASAVMIDRDHVEPAIGIFYIVPVQIEFRRVDNAAFFEFRDGERGLVIASKRIVLNFGKYQYVFVFRDDIYLALV